MDASWDFFDRVYCISLVERIDRRGEAAVQFARVGLDRRVEYVIVPRHPVNCEQGIYESHMLCLRTGLAAGAERILIFEDDVCFDRYRPETVLRGTAFLSGFPRWHLYFLGCMVRASYPTACDALLRIRYRSLTHAYAVHRDFARRLLEFPWQGVPYDDFLRHLRDDHTYAAYPAVAFQSNSRSDNLRYLPLDRLRRLLGGLRNLQKGNAFYHRHRWAILVAHGIVLMVVLLLAMV